MSNENEEKRLARPLIILSAENGGSFRTPEDPDWGGYDKAKREAADLQVETDSDRGMVIVRYRVISDILEKLVGYLKTIEPETYLPRENEIKKQKRKRMTKFERQLELYFPPEVLQFGTRDIFMALQELRNICSHEIAFHFDRLSDEQRALIASMHTGMFSSPVFMPYVTGPSMWVPETPRECFIGCTNIMLVKLETHADKLWRKLGSMGLRPKPKE